MDIKPIIDEAAKKYGIAPEEIYATIAVESGGDPSAISKKGARGLMQIMPDTARGLAASLGVTPNQVLTDPYWNIHAGTLFLSQLKKQFTDPLKRAMAYNAGPARAAAYLAGQGQLPEETVKHVTNVAAKLKMPLPLAWPIGEARGQGPANTTETYKLQVDNDRATTLYQNLVKELGLDTSDMGTRYAKAAELERRAEQQAQGKINESIEKAPAPTLADIMGAVHGVLPEPPSTSEETETANIANLFKTLAEKQAYEQGIKGVGRSSDLLLFGKGLPYEEALKKLDDASGRVTPADPITPLVLSLGAGIGHGTMEGLAVLASMLGGEAVGDVASHEYLKSHPDNYYKALLIQMGADLAAGLGIYGAVKRAGKLLGSVPLTLQGEQITADDLTQAATKLSQAKNNPEEMAQLIQDLSKRGLTPKEVAQQGFVEVPAVSTVAAGTAERGVETEAAESTITRENFRSKVQVAFNLNANEASAVAALTDSRAEAWAHATGKTIDDYYARFRDIVSGGFSETADQLYEFVLAPKGAYTKILKDYFDNRARQLATSDFHDYINQFAKYVRSVENTALRQNQKSILSVDFTTICPKQAAGKPCIYCYSTNPRLQSQILQESGKRLPLNPIKEIERLEYTDEILRMPDDMVRFFNDAMGGLRLFSAADYTPEMADIMDVFLGHAREKGLIIRAITKQPEFIRQFGHHPNLRINLSIDGLPEDITQAPVMAEALKLKNEFPNVKIRYVAINLEDALRAGADPNIDVLSMYRGLVRGKLEGVFKRNWIGQELSDAEITELAGRFQNIHHGTQKFRQVAEKFDSKLCCSSGKCGTCPVCCGFMGDMEGAIRQLAEDVAGRGIRGVAEFGDDAQIILRGFRSADLKTAVHEMGHVFRRDMYESNPELMAQAEAHFGVVMGQWTREAEEAFAEAFTQYLASGKAPKPELTNIFERLRDWLVNIYKRLVGESPGDISPELRELFDQMLGRDVPRPTTIKPLALGDLATVKALSPDEMESIAQEFAASDPNLLPKYAININLHRIQTDDDIKRLINAVANTAPDLIHQHRRGVVSEEQYQALARLCGLSVEDVLARKIGTLFTMPEQVHAARELLASVAIQTRKLSQAAAAGGPTELADYARAMAVYRAVQAQVSGLAAEAGRLLRMFRIPVRGYDIADDEFASLLKRVSPEVGAGAGAGPGDTAITDKIIQQIIDQAGGEAVLRESAKRFAAMDDLEAIGSVVAKLNRPRFWDYLNEYIYAGLLSSPATHQANFYSNAMTSLVQIPDRLAGVMFHRLSGGEEMFFGEVAHALWGMTLGLFDGFRAAWRVIRGAQATYIPARYMKRAEAVKNDAYSRALSLGYPEDQAAAVAQNKLERMLQEFQLNISRLEGRRRAWSAANMGLDPDSFWGRGIDLIGHLLGTPGRILEASDEFFKAINYAAELHARAYRQVQREYQMGHVSREKLGERLQQILNDPPADIRLDAMDYAHYQSFTRELGRKGQAINTIIGDEWRWLIPFVRTPINILKYSLEHTPLAPVLSEVRESLARGGADRAMAMGKMAVGAISMIIGTFLERNGIITGGLPIRGTEEAKSTEALRRMAFPMYSIQLGDAYYSFRRLEPLGSILGFIADISRLMKRLDNHSAEEVAIMATAAISEFVANKTWLSNLGALMDVIKYPGQADRVKRQVITELLPGSALLRYINDQFVDEIRRDTKGGRDVSFLSNVLTNIMAGVPGLSDNLPADRDFWGRKLQDDQLESWDFAFGIPRRRMLENPVDKFLAENHINFSANYAKSISGVRLNPIERERYKELVGTIRIDGKTIYQTMHDTILHDRDFKRLTPGPDGGQAAYLHNIARQYMVTAKEKLFEEFPDLKVLVEKKREYKYEEQQ